MKRELAIAALMATGFLAGCEPPSAPDAASSATPGSSETVAPATPANGAPMLDAASYPPRDDCGALPGWPAFRTQLDKAVAARDADALAAITDPDVRLDFGGGAGTKELRQRLVDPDYRLWDELAAILPLGCGPQDGGGAAMPWIFANSPADADPFNAMLVLGPAVAVRAEPDAAAPATARLNWAIVDLAQGYEGPDKPFAAVILPGGGKGYVETARLRSLVDYRLLATRTPQGWRITALIAGD
ncbi:hypothetical protein [Erythrobacter oryzae]|uniref:hypothetical protein n=1 Tax=Erythrobacter oryzae TaxID=3019556 RepID=UPI002554E807|nr:hypothetical protein [Erythrobacter sp. COR-2]